MAYIHYSATQVRGANPTVGSSEIRGVTAATISSTGSSQQSNALSLTNEGDAKKIIWCITNGGSATGADDVPVYIVFGANPTAAANGAGMRKLLMVGETYEVHAESATEMFAVINATLT